MVLGPGFRGHIAVDVLLGDIRTQFQSVLDRTVPFDFEIHRAIPLNAFSSSLSTSHVGTDVVLAAISFLVVASWDKDLVGLPFRFGAFVTRSLLTHSTTESF